MNKVRVGNQFFRKYSSKNSTFAKRISFLSKSLSWDFSKFNWSVKLIRYVIIYLFVQINRDNAMATTNLIIEYLNFYFITYYYYIRGL